MKRATQAWHGSVRGPYRSVLPLAALLLAGLVASVPRPLAAANVHVAPDGDDAADGRPGRPVATLRRALDIVAGMRARAAVTVPVTVEVADGRYELAETLVIGASDSGTEKAPTVIKAATGARPVFSGGRRIGGWVVTTVNGRPRWTATLPEVKAGKWRFAQLFVDGQRRFRPVLPAAGWFTVRRALEPSPAAEGKGHDRFVAAAADVARDWADRDAVELVAVHPWSMSRLRIASIEPAETADEAVVTLNGTSPSNADWGAFPAGARFRMENVREALGPPGSWYLDVPTGTLTYCPLDGESPETTEVVAPRLDTLLTIRGDTAEKRKVSYLRIEGLAFAHGNWSMAQRGQSFAQGDLNVGAAVTLAGAREVTLARVGIRHVGRYALALGVGTHDCRVEGCEFVDLGAGGVIVGSIAAPGDLFTAVSRNVVRDCTIRAGGRLHPAGIGVWIGQADHTTLERCDIADFTYTGVSVGWTWGYGATASHHTVVRGNHVHGLGQGVLSDMGGVYTLGAGPGVVVEENHVHDVASHGYGGWGLYADEGSTGVVMRRNVVHDVTSGCFHQHYGRDNVVENNVFAAARDWQLQRTRVEDHTSFRFEKNVVWWSGAGRLAEGDWTKRIVARDNLYWHEGGPVLFPDGKDLAARQAAGVDRGSRVADPLLADPAAGDFTLQPDSPAFALGFEPIDLSATGRETEPSLSLALPPVPSPWPEAAAARR